MDRVSVDLRLKGSTARSLRKSYPRSTPWEEFVSMACEALQVSPDALVTNVTVGGARLESLMDLVPGPAEELVFAVRETAPAPKGAHCVSAGEASPPLSPPPVPLPGTGLGLFTAAAAAAAVPRAAGRTGAYACQLWWAVTKPRARSLHLP